jgi:chromosome segregation ATPase
MCFYREVTAEHERDSGWHPDIAEAIAQAEEAAAFFTPRPIAERAESKLAGLQARAEKAEARDAEQWSQVHTLLVQAVAERDEMKAELAQARATAGRRLDEVRSLEAELAELKAQRKAEHKHSLQRAIIATLETMSTMWPKGEAPSSRL